jgi:hypothetical protein
MNIALGSNNPSRTCSELSHHSMLLALMLLQPAQRKLAARVPPTCACVIRCRAVIHT